MHLSVAVEEAALHRHKHRRHVELTLRVLDRKGRARDDGPLTDVCDRRRPHAHGGQREGCCPRPQRQWDDQADEREHAVEFVGVRAAGARLEIVMKPRPVGLRS